MEKVVPTASSKRQKEHEDDREKTVLMTLVSNKEDLSALEQLQGEEIIAACLKDANPSLDSVALSGMSNEGRSVLKETIPSSLEKLEAMNREGKVTDGICNRKEGPCFLSLFTHQDADDALEACDLTGKSCVL